MYKSRHIKVELRATIVKIFLTASIISIFSFGHAVNADPITITGLNFEQSQQQQINTVEQNGHRCVQDRWVYKTDNSAEGKLRPSPNEKGSIVCFEAITFEQDTQQLDQKYQYWVNNPIADARFSFIIEENTRKTYAFQMDNIIFYCKSTGTCGLPREIIERELFKRFKFENTRFRGKANPWIGYNTAMTGEEIATEYVYEANNIRIILTKNEYPRPEIKF